MLLVKTYLAPSPIEGLGLFAAQDIAIGDVIWMFEPTIDILFTQEDFDAIPNAVRDVFQRHSYFDQNHRVFVLCGDDARFMNHSDAPNMLGYYPLGEKYGVDKAICTIKIGQELTCDYRTFDGHHTEKLTF